MVLTCLHWMSDRSMITFPAISRPTHDTRLQLGYRVEQCVNTAKTNRDVSCGTVSHNCFKNVDHWMFYALSNHCLLYVTKGAEPPEGAVGSRYQNVTHTLRMFKVGCCGDCTTMILRCEAAPENLPFWYQEEITTLQKTCTAFSVHSVQNCIQCIVLYIVYSTPFETVIMLTGSLVSVLSFSAAV